MTRKKKIEYEVSNMSLGKTYIYIYMFIYLYIYTYMIQSKGVYWTKLFTETDFIYPSREASPVLDLSKQLLCTISYKCNTQKKCILNFEILSLCFEFLYFSSNIILFIIIIEHPKKLNNANIKLQTRIRK